MNQIINIKFAEEIMEICGLNKNAAYLANLPILITKDFPRGTFFSHALSSVPDLLDATEEVFSVMEETGRDVVKARKTFREIISSTEQSMKNASNIMEENFYTKKILIYENILIQLDEVTSQYEKMAGSSNLLTRQFFRENQPALLLSIIAFIYFDQWIAPRQVFTPMTFICSGSWQLWETIDMTKFTEQLQTGADDICPSLFEGSIWSKKFDSFAMLKALIIRIGEMGSPPIPYSIVDWNIRVLLRYLGLNDYKKSDMEYSFLKNFEAHMKVLFQKEFNKR